MSRAGLQIISTELLYGIVNKNRLLGKYIWMHVNIPPSVDDKELKEQTARSVSTKHKVFV
jgi:hypothetical protein